MEREEAAAVLARLHRAQNRLYSGGDEDGVREVLTADIVWHVPGDNAIAGDYHGLEEVVGYFRRRRDLAGSTFQMSPREMLTGPGEYVAVRTDGTATLHGRRLTWSTVGLYRVRDHRIAECWLLPLEPSAFDAIWQRPG